MHPRTVEMMPHARVALKGFLKRGDTRLKMDGKGVASSRAKVHRVRPDVMYVPIVVQKMGRKITRRRPMLPPLLDVAW